MNEKLLEAIRNLFRLIFKCRMQEIAQSRISTTFPLETLKLTQRRTEEDIRAAYKAGHIAEMGLRQAGLSADEERSFGDMQRVLSQIAAGGLSTANASDVVTVAYAIWHHEHTPHLTPFLGLPFAADAAFLVDRLSRFNCLSRDRKIQLLTMLSSFKPARCIPIELLHDPLAMLWGASRDLKELISAARPLQSRSAFVPAAEAGALTPKYERKKRSWWRAPLQRLWR